jgi:hypothetical protein
MVGASGKLYVFGQPTAPRDDLLAFTNSFP